MNSIEFQLEKIGLSPAESKVYLTLAKIGNGKAGQIISLVDLSSSNVHEVLEKLSKKGLVSSVLKNNVKEYSLSPIESLELLIRKEKEIVREKENTLKELTQGLKSIQKMPDVDQNAEVFINFNGIKSAFKRLFEDKISGEEYVFFYKYDEANSEVVHEFFSKMDIEDYYSKTKTRGLFSKEYKRLFQKRKNKIVARFTDYPIPSSINVYGKKTLIISWGEKPVAYLIESSEVSHNFKQLFEDVWSRA